MKNTMLGFVLGSALVLTPLASANADNVGTCGWGSKVFEGNEGLAPQVLALTTNGFLGNQTFAMSSGTSGCTRSGTVKSNWHSVQFIEHNKTRLAQHIAQGGGETVDALASLIQIPQDDTQRFAELTQKHFSEIFSSQGETKAEDVVASLRTVLKSDEQLAQYAANI